jgi:putative addiction module antidote
MALEAYRVFLKSASQFLGRYFCVFIDTYRVTYSTKPVALEYKTSYTTAMLKLKIRPVGGSLGIILPKEALAKMKLAQNDEVFLTEAPGGGYRLTPYSPEFERQMEVVEDIARRRRNVLRELAK